MYLSIIDVISRGRDTAYRVLTVSMIQGAVKNGKMRFIAFLVVHVSSQCIN